MVEYFLSEKNKSMHDRCLLAEDDFSPFQFLTSLLLVSRTVVNKYCSSLNQQSFTMLLSQASEEVFPCYKFLYLFISILRTRHKCLCLHQTKACYVCSETWKSQRSH